MSESVSTDQHRATAAGEAASVDAGQRLSGLAARTSGGSIWRRDSAPAATANEASTTPPVAQPSAPPAAPAAARPPAVIGRLSRVKASELWPDGTGLAAWLAATPEPLSEVLGKPPFEFASSGTNILLGTSADQQAVCVACEVGPTSDEGLGVLLRVAAVQEGGIVVWVAGEMGDAHVAALSWLNRSTTPRYYLVRVTGVRIESSAAAPIFELVARPPRVGAPASATDSDGTQPRRRVEDHVEAHVAEGSSEA